MALYSLYLCIAYTRGVKKSVGRGVKAEGVIYFTHLPTLFFTIYGYTATETGKCA